MRSGFAVLAGRPNVGKSTLVNALVGEKVSIVAVSPNTTRRAIRGVVHRADGQLVLVDTPGLHRPRSAMGERLNRAATSALADADAVVAVLDATAAIGPGDLRVLEAVLRAAGDDGPAPFVVLNKLDRCRRAQVAAGLLAAQSQVEGLGERGELPAARVEYFAVSARTVAGTAALADALFAVLGEGPPWFAAEDRSDVDESERVAELVREALLREVREELPHAIHCRVTSMEWPVVRVDVLVERESQKGIVIGHGGEVLKRAGTAARSQLPEGCYLELRVAVEPHWQSREDVLDRWGY